MDAHYQLGLALTATGDRNGAVAAFQKALELDPNYAPARESLQRIQTSQPASAALADDAATVALFEDYVRKQQFKELEPLVVDYLKTHPNSWWAHYVLGYAQFGQRRIGTGRIAGKISRTQREKCRGAPIAGPQPDGSAATTPRRLLELQQAVKLKPRSAEIRYDLAKIIPPTTTTLRRRPAGGGNPPLPFLHGSL